VGFLFKDLGQFWSSISVKSAGGLKTEEILNILQETKNVETGRSEMSKQRELIKRLSYLTKDQWKDFLEKVKTNKQLQWILFMDEVYLSYFHCFF
jgi:hypothetical protein